MKHADKYQPSSANKWVVCTGYPEMVKDIPDTSSIPSEEGILAHEIAAEILLTNQVPHDTDPEMLEYISVYTDIVQDTPGEHHIEERIDCSCIHPDRWGTCDHWSFDEQTDTLYVDDLKYGWGIVEDWWQLTCYAAGILEKLADRQVNKVILRIIQPRPFHTLGRVRTLELKVYELHERIDILSRAASTLTPTLSTGPHCKNCRAQLTCSANIAAAHNAVDVSERPMNTVETDLGRELDILYRAQEAIKNRLIAVESEAETTIRNGEILPGWSLQPGQPGRSSWTTPQDKVKNLGKLLGFDLSKEVLITPVQAIKAGVPAELVESHAKMPQAGLKLTRVEKTIAFAAFGEK